MTFTRAKRPALIGFAAAGLSAALAGCDSGATASYAPHTAQEAGRSVILRVRARADTREQVALAEELAGAHITPEGIARAFASDITQRFPETLALFEIFLHAARDPAIRDAVGEALAAKREAAAAGARAAGSPDPDTAAPALVALVHGLMLHEMAVPGCLPPESMYSAFRALFLGFLLDNGHVELALQLRRQSRPQEPNSSGAQHNS